MSRYLNWFCYDDLPPLDGRLRFFFYVSLLAAGAWKILLRVPAMVADCPPVLFEPPGAMRLVAPLIGGTPGSVGAVLSALAIPALLLWILAALGLGGRLPMLAVGVLFFVYWGAFKCCTGTGHTWHVPMYCLLALGFFAAPDERWSLDGWIARRWPGYWLRPRAGGLPATGLARKLALLAAVYTLFAAGYAKLFESGIEWLDGQSLYTYFETIGNPKGGLGQAAMDFLLAHPGVVQVLAVLSMVFELSSILAVFSPRLRPWIIVAAWMFHAVIAILMLPVYIPQMLCYTLGMDWGKLARRWKGKPKENECATETTKPAHSRLNRPALVGGWVAMSGLFLLLVATITAQREWFPLSHVPMYSTYLTAERIGPYQFADFEDEALRGEIGLEYSQTLRPYTMKFHLARRMALRVRLADGTTGVIERPLGYFSPDWRKRCVTERLGRYSLRAFSGDDQATAHLEAILQQVMLPEVVEPWRARAGFESPVQQVELILSIGEPSTVATLQTDQQ